YNAHMYRRDMNLAIDFSRPPAVSKSKLKHFRRVSSLGLEVRKDNDFGTFWEDVLIPRLQERHNAKPVHTKDEIAMLHEKFPDSILQYNVYFNDAVVAGITLFHFGNVIKSQYGATTAEGEKVRALDYLFISLIEMYKDKVNYFDMGTVNENEGRTYNSGLLKQKEELGCTVYPLDYYSVDTCVATDESIEQLP
ncbi:MAG: GNAT family N-acetyltransferase, partial [Flavobacterium sp.]